MRCSLLLVVSGFAFLLRGPGHTLKTIRVDLARTLWYYISSDQVFAYILNLPVYLPTYLPAYLPTYLLTDMLAYLPTYLPTCPLTCLLAYLLAFLLTYPIRTIGLGQHSASAHDREVSLSHRSLLQWPLWSFWPGCLSVTGLSCSGRFGPFGRAVCQSQVLPAVAALVLLAGLSVSHRSFLQWPLWSFWPGCLSVTGLSCSGRFGPFGRAVSQSQVLKGSNGVTVAFLC